MTSLPLWLFQPPSHDHGEGSPPRSGRRPSTTSVDAERCIIPPHTTRDLLPDRADAELLRGLRADDSGALEYIVRGATEPLTAFAAGYLRAPDMADDVVQHVFIRLWEERGRLPESTRLRPYLYSAVRNRALDLLKHERIVARFRDTVRAELASAAPVPPDGDETLDRERLFAAMASLSDRQREAVRLRYQAQLTVNEVAALLGLSIRGVERLLQRAIAVLRRAMGEGEETI